MAVGAAFTAEFSAILHKQSHLWSVREKDRKAEEPVEHPGTDPGKSEPIPGWQTGVELSKEEHEKVCARCWTAGLCVLLAPCKSSGTTRVLQCAST